MADDDFELDSTDKRRHSRLEISRQVRTRVDNQEAKGILTDISAGGAAIDTDMVAEDDLAVELDIENMSPIAGRIARSHEDGIAIEFDLDQEEEDRLMAEMMQIHNDIQVEDL